MRKLIVILSLSIFILVMYLCKDWMIANVPDHNYSDTVIKNKMIFIGLISIVGFSILFIFRKIRK